MVEAAVADIGSYSTKVIIGEVREEIIDIAGVGKGRSKGVRKGKITNPGKAGDSLKKAVKRAEEMASAEAKSLYLGVGGEAVDFLTSQATVSLASGDGIVRNRDLSRLKDLARRKQSGREDRIIAEIPREFRLDGQSGVTNPLGLKGRRLDTTVTLVTVKEKTVESFNKTAGEANLVISGLIPSPVSLGELFLTQEERKRGGIILDFGGETTELIVFRDRKLVHHHTFNLGGKNLTGDLAAKFNIDPDEARKRKHEIDLTETDGSGQLASYRVGNLEEENQISPVRARLKETIDLVISRIKNSDQADLLPYGIRIVGGCGRITGLVDFLSEVTEQKFDLARPSSGVHGIEDVIYNPVYGTALALLHWKLKKENLEKDKQPGDTQKTESTFARLLGALKRGLQPDGG